VGELDPGAAGRVLGWLLGNAPDAADELAAAWLEEPAGAQALLGLNEAVLPKAGRKVLRRALHRARSRGISIAASDAAVAPKVARLPSLDERIDAGYVSPFDPRGSRLVYLIESSPGGGARVSEALLDLQRGIADFQVYQAGRKQVRDFVRDVTHRERMASVPVEPAAVRALIARHSELQSASQPLPRAFNENRGRVLKGAEGGATPGKLARKALEEDADEEAMAGLLALVEQREIGPWPPAPEHLNTLVLAVRDEAIAARDEKGEADAMDLLESKVRQAVEQQYHTEMADLMAERFEELAYVYWKNDREPVARACLVTASSYASGEAAASPVATALCTLLTDALLSDLRPQIAPETAGAEEETADAAESGTAEGNDDQEES